LATSVQGRVRAKVPDGSTQDAGGCGGNAAAGQVFGAQADHSTDAEIATSVRQQLAHIGLAADRINVLHPLGPAIDVTVTVPVNTATEAMDRVFAALNSKPYLYEGVFIEIDGPAGSPLIAGGNAIRAGVGGEWDSHLLPGTTNPIPYSG
jgi:hypothetical protein